MFLGPVSLVMIHTFLKETQHKVCTETFASSIPRKLVRGKKPQRLHRGYAEFLHGEVIRMCRVCPGRSSCWFLVCLVLDVHWGSVLLSPGRKVTVRIQSASYKKAAVRLLSRPMFPYTKLLVAKLSLYLCQNSYLITSLFLSF